jgi:hypothetical protein
MKLKIFTAFALLLFVFATATAQQRDPQVHIADNAPQDKPGQITVDQEKKFEEAIKPYIEQARKTYPEARLRFLNGLPPKQSFFITTRLRDADGRFEQVFIAVKEIKDGKITGTIYSEIQLLKDAFKFGDSYTFLESELLDWTITKPDGSEEGNFVGKFLDTYQP